MKKFITRAAVVILIGGMSVAIGGCYGPFRLTSKLHHWNGQVSPSNGGEAGIRSA